MRDEELLAALRYVEEMILQLPGGVDVDADEENQSPENSAAHIGGLILKRVRKEIAVVTAQEATADQALAKAKKTLEEIRKRIGLPGLPLPPVARKE